MTRAALALVVVLCAAPAFAQQPAPALDVPLRALGIDSAVTSAIPIEADGHPGAEWLIGRNVFSPFRQVLYPFAEGGPCLSTPFTGSGIGIGANLEQIADVDGDGIQERVRFDVATQRVLVWPFPKCEPRK